MNFIETLFLVVFIVVVLFIGSYFGELLENALGRSWYLPGALGSSGLLVAALLVARIYYKYRYDRRWVIKPLRSMLDTIVERTVGGELPSSEEATDIIEQLVSSGAISMKKYSSVFYRAETVTAEAADEPLIASIGLANLWCIHVNGSFSKHQCYDEYEKYLSDQFVELDLERSHPKRG